MSKPSLNPARAVACPKCGAAPGTPCRDYKGRGGAIHSARVLASQGVIVITDQADDDQAGKIAREYKQGTLYDTTPAT